MAGTPIVSEFHDVVGTDISFAVSSRRPSMWKPTLANAVAHRANFRKAQLALIGAILAAGKRTVTPAVRVMGLGHHAISPCTTSFSTVQLVVAQYQWRPFDHADSIPGSEHRSFGLRHQRDHGASPRQANIRTSSRQVIHFTRA